MNEYESLEGRHVSVALRDGSRIDDSQLISAGRHGAESLWLFCNHADVFLSLRDVVELWEVTDGPRAAA